MFDTLILSGSSTNAMATLGALEYLEEKKILTKIKNFVGTSSGAYICCLLYIGFTPKEIICFICSGNIFERINYNFSNLLFSKPLIDYQLIHNFLEKFITFKLGFIPTLKELQLIHPTKKFFFTTYNLTDGITEFISSENYPDLSILTALRMTSNFPFIFSEFKYKGKIYLDGGITENFPISKGQEIGKKCIGIYTTTTKNIEKDVEGKNSNIFSFLLKLINISAMHIFEEKKKLIDPKKCQVIFLKLKKINFFNFKQTHLENFNLFDEGYKQMYEELDFLNAHVRRSRTMMR
jgi:NTE family protein